MSRTILEWVNVRRLVNRFQIPVQSSSTIILIFTFMLFFAPGWDPSVRHGVAAFGFSDFFGGGGQQQNGGSGGDSSSGNQQQEHGQGVCNGYLCLATQECVASPTSCGCKRPQDVRCNVGDWFLCVPAIQGWAALGL